MKKNEQEPCLQDRILLQVNLGQFDHFYLKKSQYVKFVVYFITAINITFPFTFTVFNSMTFSQTTKTELFLTKFHLSSTDRLTKLLQSFRRWEALDNWYLQEIQYYYLQLKRVFICFYQYTMILLRKRCNLQPYLRSDFEYLIKSVDL